MRLLKTAALILYNVLFICVAFGIAEYAARRIMSARHGDWRESADIQMDPWSAFRNTPDYARAGVHHTAEGFRRDRPVSLEKPPGTVRIFLIGGSVAYGGETVFPEIDSRYKIGDSETIDFYLEQKLNAALPAKHWEVINAAVKGYLLHQDLARLLSLVLRYKPDCVILLDGVNDMSQLLRAGAHYDPYGQTALREEFNALTHPKSVRSMGNMLSTWLTNNSVLYRAVRNRMLRRLMRQYRKDRAQAPSMPDHVQYSDLTPDEQSRYQNTANQLGYYRHAVQQIHRVLSLDGIQDVFALQPEIRLTRKPLAGTEARISEYDRVVAGRMEVFAFETLYPALAKQLSADAVKEGYQFLDLTNVFDQMNDQAFTDYCHLTPAGNRVVADRMFEFLEGTFRTR